MKNELPNKIGRANRRCAFPLNAGRQFGRPLPAPPSLSAAAAHLVNGSVLRFDPFAFSVGAGAGAGFDSLPGRVTPRSMRREN
jgi:hypothetical protein